MSVFFIVLICIINWVIVSMLEPSQFPKIIRLVVVIPPFAIVLAMIGSVTVVGILIKDGAIGLIKFIKG
jgi:hypothetical protein